MKNIPQAYRTCGFGGFSNFCRYYTRSQTGKSTGYRPTLKPLGCTCTCVRFIFWPRIVLLKTSWKMIFSVDFFSDLPFLGRILLSFDSFRYNWDPSMKNTESIGWLYDWFTFSPDYIRGIKQKLRTNRNKISMQFSVTGAQCTIAWAIRDGNAPYWRTHHFLMGHIKF